MISIQRNPLRWAVIVWTGLVFLAGSSDAVDGNRSSDDTGRVAMSRNSEAEDQVSTFTLKTEGRATDHSVVGTVGPILLSIPLFASGEELDHNIMAGLFFLSGGVLVGPGMGHLYAGNRKQFFTGLAIRAAGAGMFIWGLYSIDIFGDDNERAGWLMMGGAGMVLGSTIYDIATADRSAREYNENVFTTKFGITPTYDLSTGTPGIKLCLTF